jgi:hypothetical protein
MTYFIDIADPPLDGQHCRQLLVCRVNDILTSSLARILRLCPVSLVTSIINRGSDVMSREVKYSKDRSTI